MRKILLSVVCLMVIGIQSVNAQLLTAALHHNGKVTIYGSDQLSTAMNDAVAGDSLFLSEGSYPQKLTITRAISVIGTGATGAITEIRGGIEIAIPDTLSHVGCQLRDIQTTTLTVSKAVDSLNVCRCVFSKDMTFNATTTNAVVDRCQCYEDFVLSTKLHNVEIIASKIRSVEGDAESSTDVIFTNCNIRRLFVPDGGHKCLATYLNCIIGEWGRQVPYGRTFDIKTTYIYCLCQENYYTNSTYQNCWTVNGITFDDDDNVTLASGSLSDYIGNDGTAVGCTGSAHPFTLVPNTPHLTDINLDVDNKSKKLIVTMTVE